MVIPWLPLILSPPISSSPPLSPPCLPLSVNLDLVGIRKHSQIACSLGKHALYHCQNCKDMDVCYPPCKQTNWPCTVSCMLEEFVRLLNQRKRTLIHGISSSQSIYIFLHYSLSLCCHRMVQRKPGDICTKGLHDRTRTLDSENPNLL